MWITSVCNLAAKAANYAASCRRVEDCRAVTDNGANDDYQFFPCGVGKRRAWVTAKRRRRADADDPAAHTSGSPGRVLDRPGAADMAAITRWHAADLVTSAWPDQSNSLRADADYWQPGVQRPDRPTRSSVVGGIAALLIERVEKPEQDVLRHPLVQRLEPED
jgi:hypothetical protein